MRWQVTPSPTILAALVAVSAWTWPISVQAAEVCYADDQGRIVQRRRPGYQRIPCPTQEQPAAQASAEESAAPSEPEQPTRRGRRLPGRPDTADEPDGAADARRTTAAEDARRTTAAQDARRTTAADARRTRIPNERSPVPRPKPEDYVDRVPMPDRWRIVTALGYPDVWWDPYNQNTLKADRPLNGEGSEWFLNLGLVSDTVTELRDVPIAVGGNSTDDPGQLDVFGSANQWAAIENLALEFVYYKGDTVFRPPDWEFRFIPVINFNYTELDEIVAVNVNPSKGKTRTDEHVGIQALFVDKHLRNVSSRYDFDSIRVGIQPFSSDFRGFLFQDNQLGVRLFGNRRNNVFQYNLAWFRRLEKDTNSGLNHVGKALRDDDVLVANVYWQDFPRKGFVSQATLVYNRNDETEFYFDENRFIQRPASIGGERPRSYEVTYLGLNGDGHFGRLNLTTSLYLALGESDPGTFVAATTDIASFFVAAEASVDFDWIRPRASFLYATGDDDPYDDKAGGFDAVFENPQFAGADTSYWIRQGVPLIGGGRVALSGRNAVLPALRASKEEGQSNFTNPGLWLVGAGVDADLLPSLRATLNWNYLRFDDTAVLEAARNQAPIDEAIGHDVSLSLTYRPFMSQNVVVRASYARLFAGDGFADLYPNEDPGYFQLNLVLTY